MFTRDELNSMKVKQLKDIFSYCYPGEKMKLRKNQLIDSILNYYKEDAVNDVLEPQQMSVRIRRLKEQNDGWD